MNLITATEMTDHPFYGYDFDGVAGLGLSELSRAWEFNFMKMISRSRGVPNIFAMFLGKNKEQSDLALGGWYAKHLERDLAWHPVFMPDLGHWLLRIKSLRIGDEFVSYCDDGNCKGVMDSGTPLTGVPKPVWAELFNNLKYSAPLDGSCVGTAPLLHFDLEHVTITLGPEDYAIPEAKKKEDMPKQGFAYPHKVGAVGDNRNDMFCRPLLMAMDIEGELGHKLFILGEAVLRKYYSVYDADSKSIGIGLARHHEPAGEEPDSTAAAANENDDDSWFFDEAEHEAPEDPNKPSR